MQGVGIKWFTQRFSDSILIRVSIVVMSLAYLLLVSSGLSLFFSFLAFFSIFSSSDCALHLLIHMDSHFPSLGSCQFYMAVRYCPDPYGHVW